MKKRSFTRHDVNMKAAYFLEKRSRGWEDCTITKLSRKGMGITFHTDEKITVDSTLHLKVFTSDENEYFPVKGILKYPVEKVPTSGKDMRSIRTPRPIRITALKIWAASFGF